jgi:hypothetical protein
MNQTDATSQDRGPQHPDRRLFALTVCCFFVAGGTAPFNIPLGLMCVNLLNNVGGPAFAQMYSGLAIVIQVAAFGSNRSRGDLAGVMVLV